MRRLNSGITKGTLTALVLSTFATSPAAAIDPTESEQRSNREILLAPADEPTERPGWLTVDHFHVAKKAGFGYTRSLKFGERTFSFGVRGPVLRKQKAVGLNFRIRF
jgi:hypothetical protein